MPLTTSWSGFAFNGVQSVFTAYFVTYLVAFGYELGAAISRASKAGIQ